MRKVVSLDISLQKTAICVLDHVRVAVARKLAVIMHRMWVSGSEFKTGVEKPKMAAA